MPKADRDEMLRILKKVDDTLSKNWHGYEGFEELQEKLSRLRTILEDAKGEGEASGMKLTDLLGYKFFMTVTISGCMKLLTSDKNSKVKSKSDKIHEMLRNVDRIPS